MVVDIADQEIEEDAAPQLAHVFARPCAYSTQHIGNLGVGTIFIAPGLEKRAAREIGDAGGIRRAIKATNDGYCGAADHFYAGLGSLEPREPRELECEDLAARDRARIGDARKFPCERAVGIEHVPFGRRPPSDVALPCRNLRSASVSVPCSTARAAA